MLFNHKLEAGNVATVLVLVFALVGAILVIISALTDVDPAIRLNFHQYLTDMAFAVGFLAIGRGLKASGWGHVTAVTTRNPNPPTNP